MGASAGWQAEARAGGPRWVLVAAASLLTLFAALSQITAWRLPDDIDEQVYVVAGRVSLSDQAWVGDLSTHVGPVSLYFQQLGLLGVASEELLPSPSQHHYHRARAGLAPVGLLAAVLTFIWSRRLFGSLGGLCSLALFCLNPITIGYAGLANADMSHAAMSTLALFLLWRVLVRPSPWGVILAGAGLALALGAKLLAVLIAPLFALGILWRGGEAFVGSSSEGDGRSRALARTLGTLAAAAVFFGALCLTLHALYRFQGGLSPLDPEAYRSARLQDIVAVPGLGGLMALVPWPVMRGLDVLSAADVVEQRVYLRGVFSAEHWDYYLWSLLVKTPEAILLAFALALPCCIARFAGADREARWGLGVLLLAITLPMLALSTVVQQRSGIRYMLQLMPLLCIAGGALVPLATRLLQGGFARTAARTVAGVALIFSLHDAIRSAPNSIAYFNRSSGGQVEAWRTFIDSNADFGQYRDEGVEILRRTEATPFEVLRGQEGPRFGRVAVYVTDLVVDPMLRGGGPHWALGFESVAHAGAAWWLFDVTAEEWEARLAGGGGDREREALAEAYWQAGDRDAARRHVSAITATAPSLLREVLRWEDAALAGRADHAGGLVLAGRALEEGRASLVEGFLGRAEWPHSAARTWLRARSLEERRRLDEAIDLVRSSPDLETGAVNLLYLSFLLKRAGRVEEALAVLDEHSALFEGDPQAARLRADLDRARQASGLMGGN